MFANDSIIYSLYGALFEQSQYGLSLKTLCAMLGRLGMTDQASRLALSRMARRGSLFTKRKGRSSFYFLSEAGMAIMKTGESRSVKRGPPSSWDGTFRMISY
ncbi:MAG: hypothetical protein E4H20_10380, partial [Spirochaetales bacterium]